MPGLCWIRLVLSIYSFDRRSLCAGIGGLGSVHHNGSGRADRDTGTTSIAATWIDEGWFATIDLQNRLGAANVPRLALSACQTQLVDDMWDGRRLSFGRPYHHHASLRSFHPESACRTGSPIPPGGIQGDYSTFSGARQIRPPYRQGVVSGCAGVQLCSIQGHLPPEVVQACYHQLPVPLPALAFPSSRTRPQRLTAKRTAAASRNRPDTPARTLKKLILVQL